MNDKKKPRNEVIRFRSNKKLNKLVFSYDHENGSINIPDADINSIQVERSYKRQSGKNKVLSSISGTSSEPTFAVNDMIIKDYDYIMAIDTNSLEVEGNKVSICTYCQVNSDIKKFHSSKEQTISFGSFIIFNPNKSLNPELIGWYLTIKNSLTIPFDQGRTKLAIIVDSEKDSLPMFNSGAKPFFLDFHLNEQLKFCYASDKDTDTISGILLKQCHLKSNELMRAYLKKSAKLGKKVYPGSYCEWYCNITT